MPGAVTIATNMAGRGTDIQLGGNIELRVNAALKDADETADRILIRQEIETATLEDKRKAIDSGGLFVLATERHESRRIDNQLRGRAGRQGDVGASKFFLSKASIIMGHWVGTGSIRMPARTYESFKRSIILL